MKSSTITAAGIIFLSSLLSGCAMFRIATDDVTVDEMGHYRAAYDATDMRKITESVVDEMLADPFLSHAQSPPVMMIAGVQNRTAEYVDTKNLTDRMRTLLIKSGRVKFVNAFRRKELLKEQGYQAAHATVETQVEVGRQLGAKYMLTGSLTQMSQETGRQVRVSKTKMNYYKLTIEVNDLESGLITWTTEVEFARKERMPLIGW
ncbi:MAG TPA: hypothetical protein EYP57_10150 [Thermodesulfobacteriaceae bacterium]|nr:hypothetical protein [Thermodesulfobacteriaceae bacterium]